MPWGPGAQEIRCPGDQGPRRSGVQVPRDQGPRSPGDQVPRRSGALGPREVPREIRCPGGSGALGCPGDQGAQEIRGPGDQVPWGPGGPGDQVPRRSGALGPRRSGTLKTVSINRVYSICAIFTCFNRLFCK